MKLTLRQHKLGAILLCDEEGNPLPCLVDVQIENGSIPTAVVKFWIDGDRVKLSESVTDGKHAAIA